MSLLQSRILQAITYADIFEYPLTIRGLRKWIPTAVPITKTSIRRSLAQLEEKKIIRLIAPFVVVRNRLSLIGIHAERLIYSQKKWIKAYRIARFLRMIPTILFVGVTGSLAMNNANKDDDIDLCIISSKGTIWITRFLVTILVELVGHRRHPRTKNIKDTICLNMFLAEDALAVGKDRQDIYIAHELLQMIPLWERKTIGRKLLINNRWVRDLYRHAYDDRLKGHTHRISRLKVGEYLGKLLETPARFFQLWYMEKRRTTEITTNTSIMFHPVDMRFIVRTKYRTRLVKYKIPLDKKFIRI